MPDERTRTEQLAAAAKICDRPVGLMVNGYVILHFIAAAIYLAIGLYAIRLDRKARLNRIFLAICLLACLWALAIALILMENNAAVASLLYLFTSLGWGFGPGLVLAFSLELSGTPFRGLRSSRLPLWLAFLICMLPGWLIFGRSLADFLLTTNLAMGTQVGGSSFDLSLWWHYFYLAYYLLYSISAVVMISLWGLRSTLRREKLQSRWVAITLAVGVFLSFLNESLLPQMGIELMMRIPSVIMLVWIFGMLVAISRYRLMALTPALATEEIAWRMKDLLVLVDPQGRIAKVNRRTEELLGCCETELLGQPLALILKESHFVLQELKQMRHSAGRNHIQQRLTFLSKGSDGEIPVEVAITGLRDHAGDYLGIVLVAQDLRMTLQLEHEIVERRQAEEALRRAAAELEQRVEERTNSLNLANSALQVEITLREDLEEDLRRNGLRLQHLSHRLVEAQESERRNLARELHDDFGQTLIALKLMIDQLPSSSSSADQDVMERLQGLMKELLARVRNLSLDLRPMMLDDLGLLPALTWLCKRFTERTRICVDFNRHGLEERLPSDLETALFRIVQEALTNVARHAEVRTVKIELVVSSERVILEVIDQGVGFDLQSVSAERDRTGLSSMRERAAALRGFLEVRTQLGQGTHLKVSLPISGSNRNRRVPRSRNNPATK
ncbi:MAG: PAS domain S-box protein [Coprothermobacterota bacterium]|nr:PAS domain S-box protein [Coprothermobacterota bacterium]